MAKWDKYLNPPPLRRNKNLARMGGKGTVCERIVTTYLETGKSVRDLAKQYGCSKSTIGKYLNEYAYECLPYNVYMQVRRHAKENRMLGSTGSDALGSLD